MNCQNAGALATKSGKGLGKLAICRAPQSNFCKIAAAVSYPTKLVHSASSLKVQRQLRSLAICTTLRVSGAWRHRLRAVQAETEAANP